MKFRLIYLILFFSVFLLNCNKTPELLDPVGQIQNGDTAETVKSVVYTADGTKLDLFIFDGKFISPDEFFNKELMIVMDYSGNPLTHDFEPSSGYMELESIGNDEYMKITSWVDSSKNGWTVWGAVIKSPGNNNFGFREYVDLSEYTKLVFDIKADSSTSIPDNCLKVSIKDTTDPDWGGTETKLDINGITSSWQTKKYDISAITTLSVTNAYVLFEFVLEAGTPTGKYIYYIDNVGFTK